jgi:hypothetical protein
MTSPLRQAWAICLEGGVVLVQDLHCALVLGLVLAQAAGATTTTMLPKMKGRPNLPFKAGYSYSSESDNDRLIHHPDKSDTIFATFLAPIKKKGKRTQK